MQNLPSLLSTRFNEQYIATSSEDKLAAQSRHTHGPDVYQEHVSWALPRSFLLTCLCFDFVAAACPDTRIGEMPPFVSFS